MNKILVSLAASLAVLGLGFAQVPGGVQGQEGPRPFGVPGGVGGMRAGGVLSKEQQLMIKYLQRVDYCVIVGHGAEDAINQLRNQHEIMQKLQAL